MSVFQDIQDIFILRNFLKIINDNKDNENKNITDKDYSVKKIRIENKMNAFLNNENNRKIFERKFEIKPYLNNGTILHALAIGEVFDYTYSVLKYKFNFKEIIMDTITFFENHPECFQKIPNEYFKIKDDDNLNPLDTSIILYPENNVFKKLFCLKTDVKDTDGFLEDDYIPTAFAPVSCNTSGGKRKKTKRSRFPKKKKSIKRRRKSVGYL